MLQLRDFTRLYSLILPMLKYPEKLADLVEDFSTITDRNERVEALIEIADRFDEVRVPASVVTKPYPEENHDVLRERRLCVGAGQPGRVA